jgi:D-alanyl-D-alanine carboxypeptidase
MISKFKHLSLSRIYASFGLALFFCTLALGVSAQSDEVDKVVAAEMQRQKIPGVAVAVIRNGKVIKEKGYGLANVELNVPVTSETAFKIGSVSKPIIAIGVMKLVEEGKIGLDDPVGKYFPEAPDTCHTSGIIREAPGFDPLKIQPDYDVIKTAFPVPLVFAPGEKYQYCNVGYFSLAEIITRVSGKPWPEYLRELIFKPLNMPATRTTSDFDIIPYRSGAYSLAGNKMSNAESYRALRPSGAFYSNLKDMIKFGQSLETGGPVKKATLGSMMTAYKLNDGQEAPYGLGFQMSMFRGKKRTGHGGSLSGFRSDMAIFPDDKLTIIVLANLDSAVPATIANLVADVYIDFPEAPRPAP